MRNAFWRETITRARLLSGNGMRMANVIASRYLARSPRYLPILLCFVTDRCNLRCKMCGVCEHERTQSDPPMPPRHELDTEEWKGVIRSASKLHTTLISFSGGEPLLRADIYEIIRFARDQGIGVHLCSNGVLLNSERVGHLRKSGVNAVSISVESPEAAAHELLRGAGTFAPAVDAIRRLRAEAPEIQVGINFLITTANYRAMREMIPFAESLGVQQIKFAPIHTNLLHRRKRLEHYGDLLFSEEDLDELAREVEELAEAAKQTELLTVSQMFFSGIPDLYEEVRRFRCYAGYAACAVNPTGIVAPCCDMDSALSVRDQPLEEIWRSKEFQTLRTRVRHCNSSCWDTTNTELSLRLRPTALLREVARTWRDVGFYFGRDK